MADYPTMLIFPAGAKSESRKFPSKMSINSTNVLGFVLANLSRSNRLLGLVMTCNYKVKLFNPLSLFQLTFLFCLQRQNSTNDCIMTIQEEITESISFLLGEWRKNPHKRAAVLRIIKQLKEIYLKLFAIKSSCDFLEVEEEVRKLIERWQKSHRLW